MLFTREAPELRLKDICSHLKLPASTAFRILRTLETMNFVTQNPRNGKYRLGMAAFVVGSNVADMNRLVNISLPYIARLSAKYNASAHVATEQDGRVLCLEKIENSCNVVKTPFRGAYHELYLTSVGKSILAFSHPKRQVQLMKDMELKPSTPRTITNKSVLLNELETINQYGYAIDNCESVENLYCFGAPILDSSNTAIGAVSVSLNSARYPDLSANIIKDVRSSALKISTIMNLSDFLSL